MNLSDEPVNEPITQPSDRAVARWPRDAFEQFWALYPNKVGKNGAHGAVAAFEKAKTRTTFEELMAGLKAYVNKTDDRKWCVPTTWLNQDRWLDEPAQEPTLSLDQKVRKMKRAAI